MSRVSIFVGSCIAGAVLAGGGWLFLREGARGHQAPAAGSGGASVANSVSPAVQIAEEQQREEARVIDWYQGLAKGLAARNEDCGTVARAMLSALDEGRPAVQALAFRRNAVPEAERANFSKSFDSRHAKELDPVRQAIREAVARCAAAPTFQQALGGLAALERR